MSDNSRVTVVWLQNMRHTTNNGNTQEVHTCSNDKCRQFTASHWSTLSSIKRAKKPKRSSTALWDLNQAADKLLGWYRGIWSLEASFLMLVFQFRVNIHRALQNVGGPCRLEGQTPADSLWGTDGGFWRENTQSDNRFCSGHRELRVLFLNFGI